MIKILRIVTRLNIGGPSKQIETLNQLFDEQEFTQIIVTGQVLDSEMEIDLSGFNNIVKIKSLKRRLNLFYDILSLLKIIIIIRKFRPDIIHSHLSKAWALSVIANQLTGSKASHIHTFHGHPLYAYFSKCNTFIFTIVYRILAAKTSLLVAVNEITKNELLSMKIGLESKFRVIYPGFNPFIVESKLEARKFFNLQSDLFIVGYVGRIEKIKRTDILSQVINLTCKNVDNVKFLICGGGSELGNFLKTTPSEFITFVPWSRNLSKFYSCIDLLVLTSDNEGTPLVIIEAGMSGVPTLARDVGGISSIIKSYRTGFISGDSPEEIYKILRELIKSPKLISVAANNVRDEFNSKFGLLEFITSYRKLYLE